MNPWSSAAKKLLAQPAYVVVILVLATCAITLNAAVGVLRLHFKKSPVALAVPSLKQGLPAQFGTHWVQISKDQSLDGQTEEVLGTGEYVFRDYVDNRILSNAEISQLSGATGAAYDSLFTQLQMRSPLAFVRVGVTYYTGLVDTVAHIPDRCYIADGYEQAAYKEITSQMGTYPDGQPRSVKYRFISFEDQTGRRQVARNVAYVFHVNGVYTCDSLNVRFHLQDLRERYGYYAKVELMIQAPAGRSKDETAINESANVMTDFFASALPSVEKCLPDWTALHAPVKTPATAPTAAGK